MLVPFIINFGIIFFNPELDVSVTSETGLIPESLEAVTNLKFEIHKPH